MTKGLVVQASARDAPVTDESPHFEPPQFMGVEALGHFERFAQAGERFFTAGAIDDHVDANLAGVDHTDIDAAFGQGAEHGPRHAGMRSHSHA